MIQKFQLLLLAMLFSTAGAGFAQDKYVYTVDLNQVVDDKIPVELQVPKISQPSIEFQMPKIVPGTYSISDFGRFVTGFKAMDAAGNDLKVTRKEGDPNRWIIENATQLAKVTYLVDDTWDSNSDPSVFEPGGTNIEAGKNFTLNTFGVFGYFEGMKEKMFDVNFKKPAGFYGSTALIAEEITGSSERFLVNGYNLLADSPVMYCVPDTAVKLVGGAEVLVSVYSPNSKTSAAAIMKGIEPILEAQRKYLGGTLPVKKYAFILYLAPLGSAGGGMGALEHSYSSLYFMPEVDDASAGAMIKDVAAHEFFHIVTPLGVHSEEIHYFDFIEPKMSKHLWLYEGVTEYSASHVQISYDLMGLEEYLRIVQEKINTAGFFLDTVPFTEISAGCLGEYASQYTNVYQKGAVIGLCLDILLRDLSDGKMGLQNLLRKLEKEFGVEKPFEDDQLFDQITALTFPEVRKFFSMYIEGPNVLPYESIFEKVGIRYEQNVNRKIPSLGRISINVDAEKGEAVVVGTGRMNSFGKDLGYEVGDVIVSINDMEVNAETYFTVLDAYRNDVKEGDKVTIVVNRPDESGAFKKKKLKAKAKMVRQRAPHLLTPMPNPSDRQMMVRNAWLNDN